MAEVMVAMEAAHRWERDEKKCEARMKIACARPQVADRAFWAYPRAGEQLTGSTIHLMVTIAGIWGNMQYGVLELERKAAESEMLAVAWELETNTRAMTTFLVPHARDTKTGRKVIVDMRDVYENNANLGARRVREMIRRILPDWYVEQAEDICRATVERGDKPIEEIRKETGRDLRAVGVTREMAEVKIGRSWGDTTPGDLAILRIVAKSIKRGEATVREQFSPPAPEPGPSASSAPTTAELTGGHAVTPSRVVVVVDEPAAAEDDTAAEPTGGMVVTDLPGVVTETTDEPEPDPETSTQDAPAKSPEDALRHRRMKRLFALLREVDVGERKAYAAGVLGKPVKTYQALTIEDIDTLIGNLEDLKSE